MYTPVNPTFIIYKWGVRGYKTHGQVILVMFLTFRFTAMKVVLSTLCLVGLVTVHTTVATVVDLTHVYGEDVLYPPIGPGGTSKMYNFTILQRGYSEISKSW